MKTLLTKLTVLLKMILILSALSIFGCSALLPKDKSSEYPILIWPERPASPRIQFSKIIHRSPDLGIEKNVFTRIFEWIFGEENLEIVKPMSVVKTTNGVLFVADPGSGGIHRLNKETNSHDLLMLENDIPLVTPVSLTSRGNVVYVSDSTLGIFILTDNSDVLQPVVLEPPPKRASGIVYCESNATLYVVDTGDHNIKAYRNRKLVKTFGKRGNADGEFNYPTLAWMDSDGILYVTDSLNFRIQMFSSQGQFLRKFGKNGNGTGLQFRPKGIATDKYGHIYIVDSLFHSVQVFNKAGEFLLNFGAQGSDFGEFWLPTGIFIDADDGVTIYVADSYNKRIQVFRYIGAPV